MGIDGISPYDRYKKIRNLMRKQEVQNAVAGINYKKENRDFAKKCRAIERQSAFKLMLDDGLALKLKRAIRACMKGHIK